MPNGGTHHCGHCRHYVESEARCSLRDISVEASHWTTCRNFYLPDGDAVGPIYSIVYEVRDRSGAYGDIPYFDGCRVDTVQLDGSGDTVVRFTDTQGKEHTFAAVAEYLAYYKESGRES
jgi:hypothetical protein